MGLGGISIWQLLIVLAIIVLLFGTKKLRNIGSDLGNAVKSFKKAVNNENESDGLKKNTIDSKNDSKNNEQLKTEDNGETVRAKDTDTAKIAAEK